MNASGPPGRQPRGRWVVSLVNSHTNATSKRWHLWEIDLKICPQLASRVMCRCGFPRTAQWAGPPPAHRAVESGQGGPGVQDLPLSGSMTQAAEGAQDFPRGGSRTPSCAPRGRAWRTWPGLSTSGPYLTDIHQLVLESQHPHTIVNVLLTSTNKELRDRFCWRVDFLRLIYKYIMSDKTTLSGSL